MSLLQYGHCLNKRERPLHSERTSILQDEATLNQINVKYPALLMAGYFVLFQNIVTRFDRASQF